MFKGREAKLNRAIFQILTFGGNQTIYDIHKNIVRMRGFRRTHYSNVNKRVRALEHAGYLKAVETHSTKAGFEASIYELNSKTYLILLLDSTTLEDFLARMNEEIALQLSALIASLTSKPITLEKTLKKNPHNEI